MDRPDINTRSDMTTIFRDGMGGDSSIIEAMLVSSEDDEIVQECLEEKTTYGRINFLMKNRHGCYDSETEVLTLEGWKFWPDVTGDEHFLTINTNSNVIEWQAPERLVRKTISGPMVRIKTTQVDALVTPDHNMYAMRRRQPHLEDFGLVPAKDFLEASHRIRMGGGFWGGTEMGSLSSAALIGFFIGDGYSKNGSTPSFSLRKSREIDFLEAHAKNAGFSVSVMNNGNRNLLCDDNLRSIMSSCYDETGAKVLPTWILNAGPMTLSCVLDGLMHSDGSVSETGKETYSTTSYTLAGQIQEIAVKLGRCATIHEHSFADDGGHYGTKTRYRVTIYQERNCQPRIGWTTTDRETQVSVEHYEGDIHCVTVPNGTLYVRRNGLPMWCGNTPFEHNAMKFYVEAPIAVFREWHRHRIAWSYNEMSGRYKELAPVFYIPAPERNLVQDPSSKPGEYKFIPGTPKQYDTLCSNLIESYQFSYNTYQDNLDAGIAKEVARMCLPVGIYSAMYATTNARALMAFLSLRTIYEDSKFPSFPQREIEMCAEHMEDVFAERFPLTYRSFCENGRVSP